ncbi:hypothetical protein DIRU0_B08438 [Diutina rugosa]
MSPLRNCGCHTAQHKLRTKVAHTDHWSTNHLSVEGLGRGHLCHFAYIRAATSTYPYPSFSDLPAYPHSGESLTAAPTNHKIRILNR